MFSKERMEVAAILNDQVAEILEWHKYEMVNLRFATFEEDCSGFDVKVELEHEYIAVRVRTPECTYRDLTIRATSGAGDSEDQKIIKGVVDLYLYCWTSSPTKISEYVLVDMKKDGIVKTVRDSKTIQNKDGSASRSIPISELKDIDAIIHHGGK